MRPNDPGHLYVMLRSDGVRKVGIARNLSKRRMLLSNEYSKTFEIEISWLMSYRAVALVESFVHNKLRPFRRKENYRMELYDLPLLEIIRAVHSGKAWARDFLPDRSLNQDWLPGDIH